MIPMEKLSQVMFDAVMAGKLALPALGFHKPVF